MRAARVQHEAAASTVLASGIAGVADSAGIADPEGAVRRERAFQTRKWVGFQARLKPTSAKAAAKVAREWEGFCVSDARILLGLKTQTGKALVERTADGRRVEPWPANGLNRHVMARFLWYYYDTHKGVGAHEHPCIGTLRTAERWLHVQALRRCRFDSAELRVYQQRAKKDATSFDLQLMGARLGPEFTAPRMKKVMLLSPDVDVLMARLHAERTEVRRCGNNGRWSCACGAAVAALGGVGGSDGRGRASERAPGRSGGVWWERRA